MGRSPIVRRESRDSKRGVPPNTLFGMQFGTVIATIGIVVVIVILLLVWTPWD